jgi:gluconolactonase
MEMMTDGLGFPEGPVWLGDGSIAVVEVQAGRITRVAPNGAKSVLAMPGGGPNGLAMGPDGALYCCNNGGFHWVEVGGVLLPEGPAHDYTSGRIERIDLASGRVERLYDQCDGRALSGPNDLVFDTKGGFYFTDLGQSTKHNRNRGGIYYAKADGSFITSVVSPAENPNGIGLSPDGRTLYIAQTFERNIIAFDILSPGVVTPSTSAFPGRVVASFPGRQYLDSMALTADGQIAVGVLLENPGIAQVNPLTGQTNTVLTPDVLPTNICFGGADMQDAFITLSVSGRLAKTRWDRPGLKLAY